MVCGSAALSSFIPHLAEHLKIGMLQKKKKGTFVLDSLFIVMDYVKNKILLIMYKKTLLF